MLVLNPAGDKSHKRSGESEYLIRVPSGWGDFQVAPQWRVDAEGAAALEEEEEEEAAERD